MATNSDKVTPVEGMAPPEASGRTQAENLARIRQIWPWAFLVLLLIGFSIASKVANGVDFITMRSVMGILTYATQILLLALGETLIIIAAGIDLSVGWVLGFSAVIGAEVMKALYAAGASPVVTIGAGFLAGSLIAILPGILNGLLITRIRVPPFIATLGVGFLVEGLALTISNGYPVSDQPPYLGPLGNNSILYLWPGHAVTFFQFPPESTAADMINITAVLPGVVLVTLLITLVIWFILAKTQFGQHLYAIGGNYEAANRAGIHVKTTLVKAYAIAGLLAGIAGMLWAARFTSGAYNAGETTQMMSIAAVVIGGASMFGGEGGIVGTVIGSLCIAVIQFGLVLLGVPPFWQYMAVGIVVIMAVIVDQFGRTLGK